MLLPCRSSTAVYPFRREQVRVQMQQSIQEVQKRCDGQLGFQTGQISEDLTKRDGSNFGSLINACNITPSADAVANSVTLALPLPCWRRRQLCFAPGPRWKITQIPNFP